MQENQKQPNKKYIAVIFFGVLFFCSGIFFLCCSIIFFIVLFPSTYWPSVPGVITSSHYREIEWSKGITYDVIIRYDYRVSGKKYTGNRWSVIGFTQPNCKTARKLYERHPVGTSVTVYYYPKDPQKSCLIAGLPGGFYNWFFSGLGFTLSGLIVLRFVSRLFKPSS